VWRKFQINIFVIFELKLKKMVGETKMKVILRFFIFNKKNIL
jgi:hypothetical protein